MTSQIEEQLSKIAKDKGRRRTEVEGTFNTFFRYYLITHPTQMPVAEFTQEVRYKEARAYALEMARRRGC
jgi:hypothetical protein